MPSSASCVPTATCARSSRARRKVGDQPHRHGARCDDAAAHTDQRNAAHEVGPHASRHRAITERWGSGLIRAAPRGCQAPNRPDPDANRRPRRGARVRVLHRAAEAVADRGIPDRRIRRRARTPGFVANQNLADQFAEVGVILLMFGVGLQFHFKELLAVRRVAVPGALGQSARRDPARHPDRRRLRAGAGRPASSSAWRSRSRARSSSSASSPTTATCTRRRGHIAVGWLVVEDLFTVFVLVLLPAVFGPGGPGRAGSLAGLGIGAGQARRDAWP